MSPIYSPAYVADLIAKELGTLLLADKSLFGPMVAVELPLPPRFAKTDIVTAAIELKKHLYDQHTIEVRVEGVLCCDEGIHVRITKGIYATENKSEYVTEH